VAIALFSLIGFLCLYFPVMRKGSPMFVVFWVTVPVFLLYGLVVEIIVMQIVVLGFLFNSSITLSRLYRLFFNSLIFFLFSVIAAGAFYLAGGEIGSIDFWPLLFAVSCYQVIHLASSRLFMWLFSKNTNVTPDIFTKDAIISFSKVLVLIPLSLTVYFLYLNLGIGALFLVVVPYFIVVLLIRLNKLTEKINSDLEYAGIIGHEISGKLTAPEVIEEFMLQVSEMFNAEYAYLFEHNEGLLELVKSREYVRFVDIRFPVLPIGEGIAGHVLLENKPLIFSERKEWEAISIDYTPTDMQSVLCIPITRDQEVVTILLLSSSSKDKFQEYQLKILDLLCSYFTVSVEKALHLQEAVTKSNRCALTNLYNYEYMDEKLDIQMNLVSNGFLQELSIVMLDIDYFKDVNDSYGHQTGNDILCGLAKILEAKLPEGGIVSRYGGEEFVFLLPKYGKERALLFAESLRLEIENTEFLITSDLGEAKSEVSVHITVSIGVSTAPLDSKKGSYLLRNADRALYLWAKQGGRNRVAGYVK